MIRKRETEGLTERWNNGVLYFTFPMLDREQLFVHGISSRIGGVSEREFARMNLSFTRGDDPDHVRENYRRIAAAVGFDEKRVVCSHQTHTTNVRKVTEADCGKGYDRERDYTDVDGLITNVPNVILTTYYADCVPLFFVDPVHRAVGLSHSGWRGTVQDIAGVTVRAMKEHYSTDAKEILAAIGPSICQDCYEVSEDVIEEFRRAFPENGESAGTRSKYREQAEAGNGIGTSSSLWFQTKPGKYQLNLWEANRQVMLEAGIPASQIEVTDLCTCCNPDLLFSHRASHGKRGNLGAFMKLV